MELPIAAERTPWHAPACVSFEQDGIVVLLDPETPNWIATDARGAHILSWLDGRTSLDEVSARYARELGVDGARAWLHVDRFVREAERRGFASSGPAVRLERYPGRARHLTPRLRELWLHPTNACNLSCAHCLVASGPEGERGLPAERWLALIDEAAGLGVERFFLTGGEPFGRPDAFELIERVSRNHGRELTVLSNGLFFHGAVLERLRCQDRGRLRLQVSLDGASSESNDAVRGASTFRRILEGVRTLVAERFDPTVSTVVTRDNVGELPEMVRLLRDAGVTRWHLLWIHKKGRWAELNGSFVAPATLYAQLRKARELAESAGLAIDNLEEFRERVNGVAGTRIDLSAAGVESLCVYADGVVYPGAATVQYPQLALGRWTGGDLGRILKTSERARALRALTVAEKPVCNTCRFRFLCGGGDLEHAYSHGLGAFDALDPYCELYQGLLTDELFRLAAAGRRGQRTDTGFGAPVIFHAMGEGNLRCAPGGDLEAWAPVRTSRTQCVAGGPETSRAPVQEYYSRAAETPQAALCCPVEYDPADLAHIPAEVIDRFYGCGGPMNLAGARPGETVVDLGSGAGIDVFIAAKRVGPGGRAIGIDMTDPMLGVAGRNQATVAERLGYDVVEFHKGYLEEVPLPDEVADLVTSNCVINLSFDKRRVFGEMWRVLRNTGRIVVSDIVAAGTPPPTLRVNVHRWGECISGALAEDDFLAELEKAGFYGIALLEKRFWKQVQGHDFFSITVRGYKFRKSAGCVYLGHRAVYLGPYASVLDEEGHLFPRGQAIEVCTDTVAKLSHAPYQGAFAILEPGRAASEAFATGCGPGCC